MIITPIVLNSICASITLIVHCVRAEIALHINLKHLKCPRVAHFWNGSKYWVLTAQCSAKVSPYGPIWADDNNHFKYRTIPHTFTYRIVPTTIGKSWVVLCFYMNNCNTVARPCSPNHCGAGEYMIRGVHIKDAYGIEPWLLEYPIFVV